MTNTTSRDDSRTPRSRPNGRDTTRQIDVDLSLEETGPVPQDIPPRDGMENMWVRVMDGNTPAARNVAMKERQGWLPVDPKTVSGSYSEHLLVQSDKFGGVIGTHDLVLMERPKEIGDRHRALIRRRIDEKTEAIKIGIKQDLAGTGMNYRDDSRAQTEVGRRAEVAPD